VVNRPLVSVVIPAFNAEKTLPATFKSAAEQTYRALEILIVDDGSVDRTAAIARAFCGEDSRATLLSQSNAGVAAARNSGIAAARGEWVAPLDSDDLWHPTKIERQVEAALNAPERPGLVYCWFHNIDDQDRVIGSSEGYEVRGRALDRMMLFNFVGNGSCPLIHRQALEAVGGYATHFGDAGGCEDFELQLRLACKFPVEVVPEYLLGYRIAAGSMSSNPDRMHLSWQRALELFEASGGKLNPKALRWSAAYHALRRAEAKARARHTAGAARELLRALALDPARATAKLAYRGARAVRQALSSRGSGPQPIRFQEMPTRQAAPPPPGEIEWLAGALARWDKRRMSRFSGR
jgi:glycosyltransferase involved in cell wall biosynthesis